jgi:arginine exporter protein ArgO
MLAHIINYSIRFLIIIIGVLLVSGLLSNPTWDTTFLRIMGIIFILFGVYRIIIYYSQVKRYNFDSQEDDEDEEK